jgi:hypothetical protein
MMPTSEGWTFLPDAYETEAGHNCRLWHRHGSAGLECVHGSVVLRHEIRAAKLRAQRVPTPAVAGV